MEFLSNYDPNDNTSTVQGREVVIDETLVSEALSLPTSEQTIDPSPEPEDFVPHSYFKTGQAAHDKKQGWKTTEAISPDLLEWLRFVQRRLFLSTHMAYLSPKLLYPAIQAMNGMVFNWAHYVATRIHFEVDKKLQKGSFPVLLCASYLSIIVRYVLNKPPAEKRRKPSEPTPSADSVPPIPAATVSSEPEAVQPTPNKSTGKSNSQPVPQRCSRDHTAPRRQPIFTSTHDTEAGPSHAAVAPGPVKLKLHACLHQLIDVVGELDDTEALVAQLTEERAANTKWKEEVEQLKANLQVQQAKVHDWTTKFEELKLVSTHDAVKIGELKHEVEQPKIAELHWQEVQAQLQRDLTKYANVVAQLELRNTTLSADLTTAQHRITELEQVQAQTEDFVNVQNRAMRLEAQVTQLEVQLQKEFANRPSSEQIVENSGESLQETVKDLEGQLDMKTARIDQLEAQLRTLGLRNAELTEQLQGHETEDDEDDDAEVKFMDTDVVFDAVVQPEVPEVILLEDAVTS